MVANCLEATVWANTGEQLQVNNNKTTVKQLQLTNMYNKYRLIIQITNTYNKYR